MREGAWRIDPDGLREWFRLRLTGDEALGMSGAGLAEHGLPAGDDLIGVTEVDLFGGQHGDAAMAVLGIIPTEERATEGLGLVLIPEPPGKRGMVLQGLELSLRERFVVGDLRPA